MVTIQLNFKIGTLRTVNVCICMRLCWHNQQYFECFLCEVLWFFSDVCFLFRDSFLAVFPAAADDYVFVSVAISSAEEGNFLGHCLMTVSLLTIFFQFLFSMSWDRVFFFLNIRRTTLEVECRVALRVIVCFSCGSLLTLKADQLTKVNLNNFKCFALIIFPGIWL